MKQLLVCVYLIFLVTFFSGCHFNVTTNINVDEIREVVEDENSSLSTLATVEAGIFEDEKECYELMPKFYDVVEEFLPNASTKECIEIEDNGVYQLIETEFPIVTEFDDWRQTDSSFGILAVESDTAVEVYILINLDRLELLRERVGKRHEELNEEQTEDDENGDYDGFFDISGSRIKFILNNRKQTEMITVRSVFLNDKEVEGYKVFELQKKGEVEFYLSEESSEKLGRKGIALAFILN